jgi:hypothetical protein
LLLFFRGRGRGGREGRKWGGGGRTALMVDSEEVIETFYDEQLNGRKGGCEYECDGWP